MLPSLLNDLFTKLSADWLDKAVGLGKMNKPTPEDGAENGDLDDSNDDINIDTNKPKGHSGIPIATHYSNWTKARNPTTMSQLVNRLDPVINSAMVTYGGQGNPLMRSRARKLAIEAIKTYDPKSEATLQSWVANNMQGLRRYSFSLSPISVPERVRLDSYHIHKVTNEFQDANGREPTPDEIADLTGYSAKRIAYVRKLSRPVMNEGQYSKEEEDSDTYVPGIRTNQVDNIWAEYVYNDLDRINKTIYDMRMGRGKYKGTNLSVIDMAKELGLSTAAISQRANKIADKIAEGYKFEGDL